MWRQPAGPQRHGRRGGEPEGPEQTGRQRHRRAGWAQPGPRLCLVPPSCSLGRTGEPAASTASPLVSRALGLLGGLVSKGWSLPTPPGTAPCPLA